MVKRFVCFILSLSVIIYLFTSNPITKRLYLSLNYPIVYSSLKDSLNDDFIVIKKTEGHKNLSFNIKIPTELLSSKWTVIVTPQLITEQENVALPKVVINGVEFRVNQDREYNSYNDYVAHTIDSTLYKKEYVNYEQLKYDIEHMHDKYWQFYYDEWDNQINYEIWKSKMGSGTTSYFYPAVRQSYEEQIKKQYELRIKIQTQRYLNAKLDTTGIYKKYMKECKLHISKLPRYSVEIDSIKNVPKQFKYIYDSSRTLDDITDSMWDLLNKHDSVLMNLPAFDYDKIKSNEKRKFLVSKIFKSIVKFPYQSSPLLDTVLYKYDVDFNYLYNCPNQYTDYLADTISIKLDCKIIALDETVYITASQNTINYVFEGNKLPERKRKENKIDDHPVKNWFE